MSSCTAKSKFRPPNLHMVFCAKVIFMRNLHGTEFFFNYQSKHGCPLFEGHTAMAGTEYVNLGQYSFVCFRPCQVSQDQGQNSSNCS